MFDLRDLAEGTALHSPHFQCLRGRFVIGLRFCTVFAHGFHYRPAAFQAKTPGWCCSSTALGCSRLGYPHGGHSRRCRMMMFSIGHAALGGRRYPPASQHSFLLLCDTQGVSAVFSGDGTWP